MEFRQLQAFIVLAQQENMNLAAQILNTSQPQVSKLLSSLEAELGVRLFDRVGRSIHLNNHGKLFFKYANEAVSSMQNGQMVLWNYRNAVLGTVTIGTFAFGPILNQCVQQFQEENPQVNFYYLQNGSNSYMKTNEMDLLLCPRNRNHYHFENLFPVNRTLFTENYYIILSPRLKRFPEKKTSLTQEEAMQFPYIIIGHIDAQENNDFSLIKGLSQSQGFNPRIAFQVNEFAFKVMLAAQGSGAAFLPESCLEAARLLMPDMRVFSLEGCEMKRTVMVARKPRSSMDPAACCFWDFLLDFYDLEPDMEE